MDVNNCRHCSCQHSTTNHTAESFHSHFPATKYLETIEDNRTNLAFGKRKRTTDNTTIVPSSHRKLAIPIGSLLTKGGA